MHKNGDKINYLTMKTNLVFIPFIKCLNDNALTLVLTTWHLGHKQSNDNMPCGLQLNIYQQKQLKEKNNQDNVN